MFVALLMYLCDNTNGRVLSQPQLLYSVSVHCCNLFWSLRKNSHILYMHADKLIKVLATTIDALGHFHTG